MSANTLKGNLNEFKGKVKEKWGNLTDDDTSTLSGDADQLAGVLQQRLGYAKEQAAKAAREFTEGFKGTSKNDDKEGDSSMMESVGKAAHQINDIGRNVCEKTTEVAKNIKEDAGKAVTDFVDNRPYQSIAIAAIAGLVLGLLVRKKKK